MDDLELCEDCALAAWPGIEETRMGQWLVRRAGGYTHRANSANALVAGADLDEAALEAIEARYRAAGLPAVVRLTPLAAPDLDDRLAARGYQDGKPSQGMLAPTAAARPDPAVRFEPELSADWLARYAAANPRRDFLPEAFRAITDRVAAPKTFVTLNEGGADVGFGMAVASRGLVVLQAIAVDPAARGRGLGARLVESLMAWGRAQGAGRALLHVEAANPIAQRLYGGRGFERIFLYHYREKPL
ncbi:GNAT family N-acetyltransferase [Prosthecomicrobium sp. N25]|uniref:GNAT family N-acetyltransferase n=1 Tax=Prosthecomicrobium sp. N25 TaxID=3129254 RepID=UPI0030769FEF